MSEAKDIKTKKFIQNLILAGLLTSFCAVLAVTASSDDSTKTAPVPISKAKIFITNNSWDWGYTPKVPKISHIFQIKNMGGDTLRITNVAPS